MRRILSFIIFTVCICTSMHGEGKLPLSTLASNALKDVGDLTSTESLWRSRAFVAIAANSSGFEDEALAVIGSANASEEQKLVVIYGMQTLPKMDYLRFFARISELYEGGKCSDVVMALTLDPGFEWRYSVVQNYKSTFVEAKLRSIIASTRASAAIKDVVSAITSGKRFDRMIVYLESEDDRGTNATRLPLTVWDAQKMGESSHSKAEK